VEARGGAVLSDDVSGVLSSGLKGLLELGLGNLLIMASQCFFAVAESLTEQPLFPEGAIG